MATVPSHYQGSGPNAVWVQYLEADELETTEDLLAAAMGGLAAAALLYAAIPSARAAGPDPVKALQTECPGIRPFGI